ncbi:DNA-3-methyladenine glycosylase [Jonesia quinghaiensis]|uniref:DNA-3-methyladenine glycosylase n=1 Tax=Jonesia quinghaiensis TaxID=262806 RepID=UPI00040166C6|nr:DNA-3-methyladenine glycosylase [Jonesia quinghaiensis]
MVDACPNGFFVPDRHFFERPAREVAPALLNARITTFFEPGPVTVRITEVEAYHGPGMDAVPDSGSHARMGPTARNATMFGPPGHMYVYLSYGIHSAANVVCSPTGTASGLLLRAGEVVDGADIAQSRRPAATTPRDLARGPGRLAQALGITYPIHDGTDALGGGMASIVLPVPGSEYAVHPDSIGTSPRTGVSGVAGTDAFPWRFYILGDRYVSPFRAGRSLNA